MLMSAASKRPKGVFGQIFAVVLTLYGLILSAVLIGYFQLVFEEAATTETKPISFNSLSDIRGLLVGVVDGVSSERFMHEQGFNPLGYADIDVLTTAVLQGRIEVAVYDAPALWQRCKINAKLRCGSHPFGRE